MFNAIGDADLCEAGLQRAEALLSRTTAPVINSPARVRATGRAQNALRLRAPGFHTGQHFVRVEQPGELAAAVAGLPGESILAIIRLESALLHGRGETHGS